MATNAFTDAERQSKSLCKKVESMEIKFAKNKIDMFPLLNLCTRVNVEPSQSLFVKHSNGLLLHFSNYLDDLYFTKFAWIQNPFIDEEHDEFGLTSLEKKQLIELSCNTSLK